MKNKQTRSAFMPVFVLCLFLACLGMGCLGLGGGDDASSSILIPDSSLSIKGRAFFYESQVYGGIPINIKNFQKEIVTTTTTDSGGHFAIGNLPAGLYYVSATTGESEVTFGNMLQVVDGKCTEISPVSLLYVSDVVIDRISSTSFHIDFHTNRAARATIEYGPNGGYTVRKTIGQAGQTHHEATLDGLSVLTNYEVTLHITGDDGQEFQMNGLMANTLGAAGPSNISVTINNGAYETKERGVTVNLQASNADSMRISEYYNMDETPWLTYSSSYDYAFNNTSSGIKRLYVQFRDRNGTVSPVESASILYTTSGYVGIWLNDGEAATNNPLLTIAIVYPGATQMLLSDDPNFTNAYWESMVSSRQWEIADKTDGVKNLYCRFRGGTADSAEIFKASILYDTTPPSIEMILNNGSEVTASPTVDLVFKYTKSPSRMKVTNEEAPSDTMAWSGFQNQLSWKLTNGDGKKTIFAVFEDVAGNSVGPISSSITLDTSAPTGNTIEIRKTDSSTSEIATFSLVDDLPKYLHFNIADASSYRCYYFIGPDSTTSPQDSQYLVLTAPFNPVELNTSNLVVGDNKIWAYFTDEAGNRGYIQTTQIRVEGPEISVSPQNCTLFAEQEQQFTAEIKNIDQTTAGNIRWRIASGSGVISDTGLYKAPSPLYKAEDVIVRAESALRPSVFGEATINLKTSVEITYLQSNGKYTKEQPTLQIKPGEPANFHIYILHSANGIKSTIPPTEGTVTISPPIAAEYGSIATLTYIAPTTIANPSTITINFTAVDNSAVSGKVTCIVSTGANISLTKSEDIAQRNHPVQVSATVQNTDAKTLTWYISPAELGSFDAKNPDVQSTSTVSPNHTVTFYPSSPDKIKLASITAVIGEASSSINLTVYPPLSLTVDPIATNSMPIVQPMKFSVNSFEYLIPDTDETLIWEFKNASAADFMGADGKPYADRGTLTLISNNQVEYSRPVKLPSTRDAAASNQILIRATSKADPSASSTAVVNLTEKVTVKIYDTIDKTVEIATAATVIEVGKLQFYASVTPEVIGDISVKWTVNGVAQSDTYGEIDSNGKYIAPNIIDTSKVTVRATSNYDPSVYAEVEVSLSDFWVRKSENLVDATNGTPMQISSIFVDPTTETGENFIVYAGTSAENKFGYYGLWVAEFSDAIGDTSGGVWQGIKGLSSSILKAEDKYLIYAITMAADQNIYASTGDGLYWIPKFGDTSEAQKLTGVSQSIQYDIPTTPIYAIDTSVTSAGKTQILAGTNNGIFVMTLDDYRTISKVEHIIDTQSSYKINKMETHTETIGSETVSADAYPADSIANPIKSAVRAIKYDNMNKSVYFGTANNMLYHCDSLKPNMYTEKNVPIFNTPTSIRYYFGDFKTYPDTSYPSGGSMSGLPLAIAIDVVNTNTVWVATTAGISRSINYGNSWSSYSFGGTNTNCRAIIVDPNNTINVMAGSEDGLYRSIDGGSSWTRIKSGLGNYKTITCLAQGAGAAGKRRKVWVGTAGGVFVGKQSLALE